jgi:hypothetical protein
MWRSVLVLAFGMTGCVCLCDSDAAIRSRAGGNAMDCGLVAARADRTAALDCAEAAIAAGRGFQVGWREIGRDSEIRQYVAGHDGSFSLFHYDHDANNGGQACATLTESPCDDTPVRTTDVGGNDVITCTVTSNHPVCPN